MPSHPRSESELRATLRRAGLRATPQRLLVLATLTQHQGHLTAEAIASRVQANDPLVNLSTIYRTLDRLVERGLVVVTDLGEGVREFELLESPPHHHLICQRCGTAVEIDDVFAPLRGELRDRYGFDARLDHFAIFGACQTCREAAARHECCGSP